jgi:transposase
VCEPLAPLVVQLRNLDEAIARLDLAIAKMAQKDETARRLMSIPGFGPITASAMAATIQDASDFAGPREFAAFLGLTANCQDPARPSRTPLAASKSSGAFRRWAIGTYANCSSSGRMRCCFTPSRTRTRKALGRPNPRERCKRMWAKKLIEKKPFKLVAVALANKMARIAFAILHGKTVYQEIPA